MNNEKGIFDDPMIKEALFQAMKEVMEEEENATSANFNLDEHGIKGFETEDSFAIEQDIKEILDDAQMERDMRNDGLIPPEKGTRKFATVPVGVMIEYANKFGVDIMGEEVARDKWEMSKFRMWIQNEYPALMVRDVGKTKFHDMKT